MTRMELLDVTITEDPETQEVDVCINVRISGDNDISMRDAVEFRRRVVDMIADYNHIQSRALRGQKEG
ncbi:hypothetical protein [Shouchella tritolerans]|uniref:hypothetical protein n=1 Tax=Shouchella tritolerans TaxID=2979466 RepID=UPI0021E8C7F3|nr:hypothetical protein [Shouchella tritolerans]